VAISFDKALGNFESALQLRSKRAEVLSSNLANVDTPGYKARDFNFHETLKKEIHLNQQPRQTNSEHMSNSARNHRVEEMIQYRIPNQPSIDGNTVEEHTENAEFMSNSLEFQTAFTLLNSRFKGLISAIRGD